MSRRRDLAAMAAVAAFSMSGACKTDSPPPAASKQSPAAQANVSQPQLPGGKLQILRNGRQVALFNVEIAHTIQEHSIGLMGRPRLAPDAGMVFLHDAPATESFYMKNTLIPLDLAFWDAQRKLFQIVKMQPCKKEPCRLYSPKSPYLGALEVNLGALARNGVRTGDEVALTATVPNSTTPGT